MRQICARFGGIDLVAEINVTGVAGYLLAKSAAARSRRLPKDWYDIAYVLLHNDAGGVEPAAEAIRTRFGTDLNAVRTSLDDLRDNFADPHAQGAQAYAGEMMRNHDDLEHRVLLGDAVTAVRTFHALLTDSAGRHA